ncbi:hypothetical protein [Nocardia pseudobrasiliensis]|uniref:Uncharacterized protein n=1 Tax=Nocardia pseudobrasiliensis TaxID=45979 RepID=A0A370ICG8_9NOCA|nr:hypothetical protein [Nocardia pseudobrasiliensis]RDI68300.1 hypothetical protein DFR76_102701 [Nocardia pseudobrasiliensis]
MSLEIDIKEAARALVIAAGMATNVAHADIARAAQDIAKHYPKAHARQVEAEIARHLRNRG